MTTIVGIRGTAFRACANCHLPVDFFPAYKKTFINTVDCPFCDGLGWMPYSSAQALAPQWGPCLNCHPQEYNKWRRAQQEGSTGFSQNSDPRTGKTPHP